MWPSVSRIRGTLHSIPQTLCRKACLRLLTRLACPLAIGMCCLVCRRRLKRHRARDSSRVIIRGRGASLAPKLHGAKGPEDSFSSRYDGVAVARSVGGGGLAQFGDLSSRGLGGDRCAFWGGGGGLWGGGREGVTNESGISARLMGLRFFVSQIASALKTSMSKSRPQQQRQNSQSQTKQAETEGKRAREVRAPARHVPLQPTSSHMCKRAQLTLSHCVSDPVPQLFAGRHL